MKLTTSQIGGFLQHPDEDIRVILIYGPDTGLVSERAEGLARKFVPDINDPFSVASLSSNKISEDGALLADEMAEQSLMGGKRLVRVSQITEAITPAVTSLLLNLPPTESLLLLEAGDLDKRSKLRAACENGQASVAIPCYIETGAALQRIVSDLLQAEKLKTTPEVLAYLCEVLPPDRLALRSEIDKLALYAQGKGAISIEDITTIIQDAGSAEMDDLVYFVGNGDARRVMKLVDRLFAEQTSGVAILRAAQRHFLRVQSIRAQVDSGMAASAAVERLQPPVFWKYKDLLIRQIARWPAAKISRALHALQDTEAALKLTGANEAALCGQLLLGLSS